MLERLSSKLDQTNLTLVILGMIVTQTLNDGHDAYMQFILSALIYGLISLGLIVF